MNDYQTRKSIANAFARENPVDGFPGSNQAEKHQAKLEAIVRVSKPKAGRYRHGDKQGTAIRQAKAVAYFSLSFLSPDSFNIPDLRAVLPRFS